MRTALALAMVIGGAVAAMADTGAVIAVPTRPGVPIIINGRDAAYGIVEGDWGLAKGQRIPLTVYGGGQPYYKPPAAHYYPSAGSAPAYGRAETDTPPRHLPRAENFSRVWSAESQMSPPEALVPFDPPPVIVAPRFRGGEMRDFR